MENKNESYLYFLILKQFWDYQIQVFIYICDADTCLLVKIILIIHK